MNKAVHIMRPSDESLDRLLKAARSCRACEAHLRAGPRPILQANSTARILIVSQAPGARVHVSGIPWSDRSGERLREWMNIDLTLLIGGHAQSHFRRDVGHVSVTATTRNWRAHTPDIVPLPHPSPCNIAWFKANHWFDDELVPALQRRVRKLVDLHASAISTMFSPI